MTSTLNRSSTIVRIDPTLSSHEGLRIPSTLDNVGNVTFVLTQEHGKLKPKDLKIAIEKNRAEKELRAQEQKKIREEGGGGGILDLRAILAEERLNGAEGDPFKRQLREMAFLADVDDVEKMEVNKGFRISEEFLGSNLLSEHDIKTVYKQRTLTDLHKRRTEWRSVEDRQKTNLYSAFHPYMKAGASAENAHKAMSTFSPVFDANRNDIWGKRMNTLRRFVSLVSRWIIRERVTRRMGKITQLFADNGAVTKQQVKEFIEQETMLAKKQTGQTQKPGSAKLGATRATGVRFDEGGVAIEEKEIKIPPSKTVPAMMFSKPNDALIQRELNEAAAPRLDDLEVHAEMCRRILFPQCPPEESDGGGTKNEITPFDINKTIGFDDRTFFQLKVEPEYQVMEYNPKSMPACTSLYFPPTYQDCHFAKGSRQGALEEFALMQPVDKTMNMAEFLGRGAQYSEAQPPPLEGLPEKATAQDAVYVPSVVTKLPPQLAKLCALPADLMPEHHLHDMWGVQPVPVDELNRAAVRKMEDKEDAFIGKKLADPAWLTAEENWDESEFNYLNGLVQQKFAVFGPVPRRIEIDAEWDFRPENNPDAMIHKPDSSLRTEWMSGNTFKSVNRYLLGAHESLSKAKVPPPGPTLSDYYLPDDDRHKSGFSCWQQHDHFRAVWEKDTDVAPLQRQQDKADYLTDSESDDDEAYPDPPPTMKRVRKLLKPAATEEELENMNDSRKETQVEMMIDRKRMELSSTIWKRRADKQDNITKRLENISRASKCALTALHVQQPFHKYEEELYRDIEQRMKPVQSAFVRTTDDLKLLTVEDLHEVLPGEESYTMITYPDNPYNVTL